MRLLLSTVHHPVFILLVCFVLFVLVVLVAAALLVALFFCRRCWGFVIVYVTHLSLFLKREIQKR